MSKESKNEPAEKIHLTRSDRCDNTERLLGVKKELDLNNRTSPQCLMEGRSAGNLKISNHTMKLGSLHGHHRLMTLA